VPDAEEGRTVADETRLVPLTEVVEIIDVALAEATRAPCSRQERLAAREVASLIKHKLGLLDGDQPMAQAIAHAQAANRLFSRSDCMEAQAAATVAAAWALIGLGQPS
jgi:hypothetical protein